jgi:hypothetical protein
LRELIASFVNTLCRWYSTVRGLMNSCAPISGFVWMPRGRSLTAGGVAKGHPGAEGQQARRFRRIRRLGPEIEAPGRPHNKPRIADRLGRGDQQQPPAVSGEALDSLPEALLDPTRLVPQPGEVVDLARPALGEQEDDRRQFRRRTTPLRCHPVSGPACRRGFLRSTLVVLLISRRLHEPDR